MAQIKNVRRSMTCTPAALAGTQTWSIAVKKGWRIKTASMQRMVSAGAATDNTFAARVNAAGGGAAAGLMAATDPEGTVGSIVDGAGADLNSGRGYLMPSDGQIDILFTTGGTPGAIIPSVRFTFLLQQEYPY